MRYTIPHEAAIPNSQTRGTLEREPQEEAEQAGGGTLTLTGMPFQATFPLAAAPWFAPKGRSQQRSGFRISIHRSLSRVGPVCGLTRRYQRNRSCFLFLPLVKCFNPGRSRAWLRQYSGFKGRVSDTPEG